ncbi:hypothetical protein [Luteolibacter sp. Populi]|uniref:hypothetical protein n=1 Tax=Luteolibacter sp. Populi TaxID=3230487 RepID=UPI003465A9E3
MRTSYVPFIIAALLGCGSAVQAQLAPITAVETKVIAVTGFPGTEPSHTVVSDYGIKPTVILTANADNSCNVAFHDSAASKIAILSIDAAGNLVSRLDPAVLQGATELIGFARIPGDGSFGVAYAKNNAANGPDFEYWIARVSPAGATLFNTLVFGTQPKGQVNSKGEPGYFSSGRLAFNPATQNLISYTGHSQRHSDGIRHQGGHVATMSLAGVLAVANPWYCSHNFDQRLLVDGSNFYTLAHGDAFPRGLVFGRWQDAAGGATMTNDVQFFTIPGTSGDNVTNTQTGGFVKLASGNIGIVYSTKAGRNNYDVRYRELTPAGQASGSAVWLTSYPAGTFAIFPKIVRHGDVAAVFWEEVTGGSVRAVRSKLVGTAAANATAMATVSDTAVRVSAYYDMAPLPNGGILWASHRGAGSLALQRVVSPAAGTGGLRLGNVAFGKSGANFTISGSVSGGASLGTVFLQASSDMGRTDAWQNIATIPLNAAGQATFGPVTDPGGGSLGRNFFRLDGP